MNTNYFSIDSEYHDWAALNEARNAADQQEADAKEAAETHFLRLLNNAIPMHRVTISGAVMVGWMGAATYQYIPLDRAVSIWRGLVSVWV